MTQPRKRFLSFHKIPILDLRDDQIHIETDSGDKTIFNQES